jgi:actin-related protein
MPGPTLATAAAGLRTALVVDIGWAETLVTAIYEYREVQSSRTIRASKYLSREMLKLLATSVDPALLQIMDKSSGDQEKACRDIVSFEECEEVVARMAWCKSSSKNSAFSDALEGLPSVLEEEELDTAMHGLEISGDGSKTLSIPLTSTQPPKTLHLPFAKLAEPCEKALFADGIAQIDLDDEELPLHLLVYNSLLRLPVDIRSVCMSRIIFTGGGSHIPGLKKRIMEEVKALILDRDWDPVQGKAVEQLRNNPKLRLNRSKKANVGPTEVPSIELDDGTVVNGKSGKAAFEDQERDPIEDQIRREAKKLGRPHTKGVLRAVESLGSWSGASLLQQLKIPAASIIEREQWQQHGLNGASKSGEGVVTNTRQSMGPAGLRAIGSGDRSSWTLGPWA